MLGKIICFLLGRHQTEACYRPGPTGDPIRYYYCPRCEQEVTKDDWL